MAIYITTIGRQSLPAEVLQGYPPQSIRNDRQVDLIEPKSREDSQVPQVSYLQRLTVWVIPQLQGMKKITNKLHYFQSQEGFLT